MAPITIATRPAAGPLTPRAEPLNKVTTIPPTIPAIKPDIGSAPDATLIPIQRGNATKKTTSEAGISFFN